MPGLCTFRSTTLSSTLKRSVVALHIVNELKATCAFTMLRGAPQTTGHTRPETHLSVIHDARRFLARLSLRHRCADRVHAFVCLCFRCLCAQFFLYAGRTFARHIRAPRVQISRVAFMLLLLWLWPRVP